MDRGTNKVTSMANPEDHFFKFTILDRVHDHYLDTSGYLYQHYGFKSFLLRRLTELRQNRKMFYVIHITQTNGVHKYVG